MEAEARATTESSFREDLKALAFSLSRLIDLSRIRDRSPVQFAIKKSAVRMHSRIIKDLLRSMALRLIDSIPRVRYYHVHMEIGTTEKILQDTVRNAQ